MILHFWDWDPHVAFEILKADPVLLFVSTPMIFSVVILNFNAMQTHAFFLFNEYIDFDKKSYGPLEHIPLFLVALKLAQNVLYVTLALKLKR